MPLPYETFSVPRTGSIVPELSSRRKSVLSLLSDDDFNFIVRPRQEWNWATIVISKPSSRQYFESSRLSAEGNLLYAAIRQNFALKESYYVPLRLNEGEQFVIGKYITEGLTDVQKGVTERREKTVLLQSLLEKGAIIVAVVCMLSLTMWALADFPLVSPFLSILGLVVSPFVYWMGNKKNSEE